MAHFIYATEVAPRVMFAPAGYFCTACPTVIVDEGLIATGVKDGYRFRAVVGVDYLALSAMETLNLHRYGGLKDLFAEERLALEVAVLVARASATRTVFKVI